MQIFEKFTGFRSVWPVASASVGLATGLATCFVVVSGSEVLSQGAYGDGSFSNNPMLSSRYFSPNPSADAQPLYRPGYVLDATLPIALEPSQPRSVPIGVAATTPIYKGTASVIVNSASTAVLLAVPQNVRPVAIPIIAQATVVPVAIAPVIPPVSTAAPIVLPIDLAPSYSQTLRPAITSDLHPAFEVDWSVGLRGAFSFGTKPSVWSAIITPQVDLTFDGRTSQFSLSSEFEGVVTTESLARVSAFNTQAVGAVAINPVTALTYGASVNISQGDVNAPGAPVGVDVLPITLVGAANVGVVRQFGQLSLDASLNGSRTASTDTYLTGGAIERSADQNFWGVGGSLRASFQATPIFAPFVEVSADRSIYDVAPATTGIKLSNNSYSVRGGAVAIWQDSLSFEASTGYTLTQFDDGSLNDLGGQTFAVAVTFAPPSGVSVGFDVDTTYSPGDPDNSIGPMVGYGVGGSLGVDISDRLLLSASASANWQAPLDIGTGTLDYSLAAGAAYSLNAYAAVTLDYTYSAADDYIKAVEDEHVILVGVTVSRPE